ncbi:MAG: TLD domain-containing protein [Terracidiphilus sp.]|nr:TLD domain-containing protein [Terracidiphilus sp.]
MAVFHVLAAPPAPVRPADSALGLQASIASLADRLHSLPRRFGVSRGSSTVELSQWAQGLTAAEREAAVDCGVLASHAGKALESAAEEARVAAAQLEAYAVLLEREAEDGEERGVEVLVHALLCRSPGAAVFVVSISRDAASLFHAVEAAVRVRDGIDLLRCTVSGLGLRAYHAGDNRVICTAVDAEGEAVESIEAEDVCLCLSVNWTVHKAVSETGVVDVVYRVPEGCVGCVSVGLSVCGVALSGSPWRVAPPLGDSAILARVDRKRLAAFLRVLSGWLPDRSFDLVYRGSRFGMTPDVFHRVCDNKGPTLTLVRCSENWVFGGYAGASWASYEDDGDGTGAFEASHDAFLLSVVGPHSPGPVRFPVVPHEAWSALWCDSDSGPNFHMGLTVDSCSPADKFHGCMCEIDGVVYEDVLGKGVASLTGKRFSSPVEMEVFAVKPCGT